MTASEKERWFPADESLRAISYDKLLPPLVAKVRRKVSDWRRQGYAGALLTSRALLHWWFDAEHLLEAADGPFGLRGFGKSGAIRSHNASSTSDRMPAIYKTWLAQYRRLTIWNERLVALHRAFLHLGCPLICLNYLSGHGTVSSSKILLVL